MTLTSYQRVDSERGRADHRATVAAATRGRAAALPNGVGAPRTPPARAYGGPGDAAYSFTLPASVSAEFDEVAAQSYDSFPASDPPSWTGVSALRCIET
jgi:hypothetical protein